MVREFQRTLSEKLLEKQLYLTLWEGSPRKSQHLLNINTSPETTILYVKSSNASPGFWGLTRNHIDRLNFNKARWFAVLLLHKPTLGYIFSQLDVNNKISDGSFELSGDGDYKVNEKPDCTSDQMFRSIDDIIKII